VSAIHTTLVHLGVTFPCTCCIDTRYQGCFSSQLLHLMNGFGAYCAGTTDSVLQQPLSLARRSSFMGPVGTRPSTPGQRDWMHDDNTAAGVLVIVR
jgi:hypothetical protein